MILVVDDHADSRSAVVTLLRLDGYDAVGVGSGGEALAYLESNRPHCVLLDYNMPGMDGLTFLKTVRANRRFDAIRVIMFTAQESIESIARAAGADGFILKASLDWAKLSTLLKEFCWPSNAPGLPTAAAKLSDKRTGLA